MTTLLQACERRQWQLAELAADATDELPGTAPGHDGVTLTLSGYRILAAPATLACIDGVTAIRQLDDDLD